MEETYAQSITINQSFWSEADIDNRFKAGDQTLWNDIYGNLPAFRRRVFNFNRIRRVCNMISGFQRNHRKSTTVIPVENSDEKSRCLPGARLGVTHEIPAREETRLAKMDIEQSP